MRKIVDLILLCFIGVSCSNINEEKITPTKRISFTQEIISSGYMKTKSNNIFEDIINDKTPKYVNVTLTNKETKEIFSCKSNENIVVPLGTYEISAEYTSLGFQSPDNNFIVYDIAPLKCKKFEIQINNQTISAIHLNLYYDCYAIFIDSKNCLLAPNIGEYQILKIEKEYYTAFCQGTILLNIVPPINTEYIHTSYILTTDKNTNNTIVEYGKYYVIQPKTNNNISTVFESEIKSMTQGFIE